ncbi:hypothetical protein [Aquimarina hainanensis]
MIHKDFFLIKRKSENTSIRQSVFTNYGNIKTPYPLNKVSL